MERRPERPRPIRKVGALRRIAEKVTPGLHRRRVVNERVTDLLRRRREQLQRIMEMEWGDRLTTTDIRFRMITNFALEEAKMLHPEIRVPDEFRETLVTEVARATLRRPTLEELLNPRLMFDSAVQKAFREAERVIGPLSAQRLAQAWAEQNEIISKALDSMQKQRR